MTVLFSGTHLHEPTVVLNLGESASLGTGMMISTLFAVDRLLNWLFAYTKTLNRLEIIVAILLDKLDYY